MNRRDTIKTLIAGTAAAGLTAAGCKNEPAASEENAPELSGYRAGISEAGQFPEEKERDAEIFAEGNFFDAHETATLSVLAALIIPADEQGPSAAETDTVEFMDFMMYDLPYHQLPMRGGLKWLDYHCVSNYEAAFKDLTEEQQTTVLDLIAYPEEALPEHLAGVKFFTRLRNLVTTGYFTSKAGTQDVGYAGNYATFWDGVPPEVLEKHGLSYDEKMKDKYIKAENRETLAQWDEEGNLLTGG